MNTQAIKTAKVATTPNFRTNADQLVSFFGHGDYTVKFLGKCPITGTRLYDLPGASHMEHQPLAFVAAEHGMTGPDMLASWQACNNDSKVYEKALALAKEDWLPGPEQVGPTRNVVITGRRWFDRVNGNTYFSAVGIVNGAVVARIAYRYGYSNQYEYEMTAKLEKLGFLPDLIDFGKGRPQEPIWNYADRKGCTYNTQVSDVSRKKDL